MLPFLLSALFLIGPGGQTAPAKTTTYQDDNLHFSFTYPASLGNEIKPAEVMDLAKKSGDANLNKVYDCITLPLFGTHSESEESFELMMMMRVDFDCLKAPVAASSLGALATGTLTQGLAKLGPATVSQPVTYKLDAHDAVLVQGESTAADSTKPAYASTACALVEHSAVCWTVIARDKARMAALLASPVAFGDHPGQALVPATMLVAPVAGK